MNHKGYKTGLYRASVWRYLPVMLAGSLASCSQTSVVAPGSAPEVFPQLGHSNTVKAVAFSSDGRILASVGKDRAAKLWDVSAQRELRTLKGSDELDAAAFSADDKMLATGGRDGMVVLWELSTGREVHVLNAHTRPVNAVAFSPDGRTLASGSDDHTIKLWSAGSGAEMRTLSAHHDAVTALAFSPDGRTLASASRDKTIKLWEASTGQELRTLNGHTDGVTSLAFCPSSPMLASGSWDGTARLWDYAAGREARTLTGHASNVSSVACTRDGRAVAASGGADHRINLWDVASGRALSPVGEEAKTVETLAFSPDGRVLASAGEADSVALWDVATGRTSRTLEGHAHFVKSVSFSADGRSLVSGSVDGVLRVWQLADAKRWQRSISAHDGMVTAAVFSPGGGQVVSRGSDGAIKIWDSSTLALQRTFEVGKPPNGSCSLAVSADSRLVAAGTINREVKLWSLADGTALRSLAGHAGAVEAVAFSPDGHILASGSTDKTIKLWDVSSGLELGTLVGHTSSISCLSFSPDGQTLASGGTDKTVRLWDVARGREQQRLLGHTGAVWAVAFAARDAVLASSDNAAAVKLWNVSDGREQRTLHGHADSVESVAFSPDGHLLASASEDSTIRLWDTASGTERLWLIAFNDGSALRITPHGYYDFQGTNDQGGTADAEAYLNVRVGNQVSGIGAYREKFYRPDIVRLALDDQKLPDTLPTLASVKPAPEVAVLDVPTEIDADSLELHVRVIDRGGGVGEVRTLVNGTAVSDAQGRGLQRIDAASEPIHTIHVRLLPGRNDIQIIALNADGSVQSNPALASVFARYSATSKPQLYALVVGIQEFANSSFNLRYSVADAKAIAQVLQQKAAPLFDKVNVETLTTQEMTTKQALTAAFARYRTINPSDTFLFYVASHGVIESADLASREYFLVPSSLQTFSEEALRRDALSESELKRMIASIPATRKLMILDTCHAGAMGDAMMVSTRDLAESGAVTVIASAVGSTVLSASTSDEEALEGENGHGLFTSVLLRGLSGSADLFKKGSVKTLDLAVYLDQEVPVLAMQHFKREQYPNTHSAGRSFEIVSSR